MGIVELYGLIKGGHHTLDLLIGEQTGKSRPAVIVNGDVQAFDASAAIAQGAISSGTHARTLEAAQLLDVQVQKFSRSSAFVALHRWLWRLKRGEPMQAMTAQDTRDRGLGGAQKGKDLRIGAPLPAQGKNVSFELGTGHARLPSWDRGTIVELGRESRSRERGKAICGRFFVDVIGGGNGPKRKLVKAKMGDHFSSHPGGESGISVHVVRAGF
jgi:hypothetical protein